MLSCTIQVIIQSNPEFKWIANSLHTLTFIFFKDRFPNESEEVKKEEEKKFKEVGESYAEVSDDKKRSRYDNGQDLDDMGSGMGGGNQSFISFFFLLSSNSIQVNQSKYFIL